MGQGAREVTGWDERPAGEPAEGDVRDEPEVEQLVGDIEVTREEMTVTVEEIGDRLDPGNIVANAKETVRDATVGKVEQMASSAEEMVSNAGETVQEAGSSIVETIRRNPVPAAMVGIGLGWLAMSARSPAGNRGLGAYGQRYGSPGYRYPSYAREGYPGTAEGMTGEGVGERISDVGRRAGEMADDVGRTVERRVDQFGDAASRVPYEARDMARQLGDEAGRVYHHNPLAMGAIALAVGTAIGLVVPVTQMERQAVGRPARQLLGKAEEAASDALGQAEQQARDAEQQAREEERAKPH